MRKLLVLSISLASLSAFASIPIVDAVSVTESSTFLEVLSAAMDNDTLIAALLCLFLGTFGIHWFYLKNKKKGMQRLGLTVVGYAFVFLTALLGVPALSLVGSLIFLANFVLVIMDLIKILTGKV